eukprot:3590542-Prymnesium_polylepis.1
MGRGAWVVAALRFLQVGPGGDAFLSSACGGAPFRPSRVPSVTRVDDRGCLGVWSGFHQKSPTPRGPLTLIILSALDLRNGGCQSPSHL